MKFLDLVLPSTVSGWTPVILKDVRGALTDTQWFEWPVDRVALADYVDDHSGGDVYFSPMLYTEPATKTDARHARKANVTACSVVYADADEAQPHVFGLTPTVTVETSEGRWHTYWALSDSHDPQLAEELAHAVYLRHRNDGVDSGWGLSKRLRVPGTLNTKNDQMFPVRAYQEGDVYTLGEVAAEYVPAPAPKLEDREAPQNPETAEAVLNRIPFDGHTMDLFMRAPIRGSRSTALFTLEMKLFEEGLTAEEVYSVALTAACNKFAIDGRGNDELWRHVLATEGVYRDKLEQPDHEITKVTNYNDLNWTGIDLLDKEERDSLKVTFIDRFADWVNSRSKATPRQYAETAAWAALSVVFSEFGHVVPSYGKTPLNLYLMVMGQTTRSRKSTSKNFLVRVLDEIAVEGQYDYDLGSDATAEALTEKLSTRPGKSSFFWRDEVQGLFDGATSSGHYLRGLLPMLTDTYDGAVRGVLRKTGTKETKRTKTSLVFYGMGIADQIADALTDDDFYSGFLPRILMVLDEGQNYEYGSRDVEQVVDRPGKHEDQAFLSIVTDLRLARRHWETRKSQEGDTLPMVAEDAAWKRWQEFSVQLERIAAEHPSRAPVLMPGAVRLTTSALKCAALLAMVDQRPTINMHDMLTAIHYAGEWAKYMEQMSRKVSTTAQAKEIDELEKFVNSKTSPPTYAQCLALFKGRKTVREFADLLAYCVETGTLAVSLDGRTKKIRSLM